MQRIFWCLNIRVVYEISELGLVLVFDDKVKKQENCLLFVYIEDDKGVDDDDKSILWSEKNYLDD